MVSSRSLAATSPAGQGFGKAEESLFGSIVARKILG